MGYTFGSVILIMQKSTTVILADAHFLTRVGMKNLFLRKLEFRILGEVENEDQLLELVQKKNPDLVLIDLFQEGKFSVDSMRKVKALSSKTNFLIITDERDKSSIFNVLENKSVRSFLTKECDEKEITEAIETISSSEERYYCKKIINLMWEKSFGKEDDCDGIPLSARQIQIVKMVVNGKITKEIAEELGLSPHTVYTHRKNIMKKLGLNSTPELVLYAVNHGLVKVG